jgi:PPOX class probable F420-dependent enzyme
MDLAEALAFISIHHNAVLSTTRRDGHPAMTPVTAGVDTSGRIIISTRETALKVRNIGRDPYVSLLVVEDGFYGPWTQIEGRASVLELPDAMEPLVEYYRFVAGEHPDWAEYRQAMIRDRRVLVRIEVERVGPVVAG